MKTIGWKRLTPFALAMVMQGIVRPSPSSGAEDCAPSGGLMFICEIQNPEDLVHIPSTGLLIASSMIAGGGLHLVDTKAKSRIKLQIGTVQFPGPELSAYTNCSQPLNPKQAIFHGLSLRPGREDGQYTLYAVNHGGRESIEVFHLHLRKTGPSIKWIGCVTLPPEIIANSVATFSDGAMVVTVPVLPGHSLREAVDGNITGAVFLWTPESRVFKRLAGTELPANNGIETSADGHAFYVVSMNHVVAYSRANPAASPRKIELPGFMADNIHWASGRRLIVAGVVGTTSIENTYSARGYVVATLDPDTSSVSELVRGPAIPTFSGASVAAKIGAEVWIGSSRANRIGHRPFPGDR